MKIEQTPSKYKVGCGKGYGIDIPNLEFKLNLIVDKENSTWVSEDDKELHEGDTFLIDGTLLAVDHDRLVQVISETGPFAFERIYETIISPEIEMSYFEDEDYDYSWEEIDKLPEDIDFLEYTPKYHIMEIWHNKFEPGKNLRPVYTIKVTLTDKIFGITSSVYLQKWKLYYQESEFTEEMIEFRFKKIMSWFYSGI